MNMDWTEGYEAAIRENELLRRKVEALEGLIISYGLENGYTGAECDYCDWSRLDEFHSHITGDCDFKLDATKIDEILGGEE